MERENFLLKRKCDALQSVLDEHVANAKQEILTLRAANNDLQLEHKQEIERIKLKFQSQRSSFKSIHAESASKQSSENHSLFEQLNAKIRSLQYKLCKRDTTIKYLEKTAMELRQINEKLESDIEKERNTNKLNLNEMTNELEQFRSISQMTDKKKSHSFIKPFAAHALKTPGNSNSKPSTTQNTYSIARNRTQTTSSAAISREGTDSLQAPDPYSRHTAEKSGNSNIITDQHTKIYNINTMILARSEVCCDMIHYIMLCRDTIIFVYMFCFILNVFYLHDHDHDL